MPFRSTATAVAQRDRFPWIIVCVRYAEARQKTPPDRNAKRRKVDKSRAKTQFEYPASRRRAKRDACRNRGAHDPCALFPNSVSLPMLLRVRDAVKQVFVTNDCRSRKCFRDGQSRPVRRIASHSVRCTFAQRRRERWQGRGFREWHFAAARSAAEPGAAFSRVRTGAHTWTAAPPSTVIVSPWMRSLSGLARNSTTSATSSALRSRPPIIIFSWRRVTISLSNVLRRVESV